MKTICSCYGYRENEIFQEILDTGISSILINIETAYNLGLCSCKTKNPSKQCCLPEVRLIAENAMIERLEIIKTAILTLELHGVNIERLSQKAKELFDF